MFNAGSEKYIPVGKSFLALKRVFATSVGVDGTIITASIITKFTTDILANIP